MMVNVKLERDNGGEDNVKSWIAKLPSDDDVSNCCGCLLCCKVNFITSSVESNRLILEGSLYTGILLQTLDRHLYVFKLNM